MRNIEIGRCMLLPDMSPCGEDGPKMGDLIGSHDVILAEGDATRFLMSLPPESVSLIVTSPPYNIGKEYERGKTTPLKQYVEWQREVISAAVRCLKPGGHICWQVGNYVKDGEVFPLDCELYPIFRDLGLRCRNRIVWSFEHGLHCTKRLSGRHEAILWFTKGDDYFFDVDPIRVPQKYPGKKQFKGPKKGQLSGNPLGKSPGDTWKISDRENLLSLAVESHAVPIGVKEFGYLSDFVSRMISEYMDASVVMDDWLVWADVTSVGEDSSYSHKDGLSPRPLHPNFLRIGSHPYATITIKKSPDEISVEIGRNRWIFHNESLVGDDAETTEIVEHTFAVHAQRLDAVFLICMNWVSGIPLPSNILDQLMILGRESDGVTVSSSGNGSITHHEPKDIGTVMGQPTEIPFIKAMLAVALLDRRVPISPEAMIVPLAESSTDDGFVTQSTVHIESPPRMIHMYSGDAYSTCTGDVWDIPNVKSNHCEKTDHPCQFPVELVERLVLSMTQPGDIVVDPFAGVGSSLVAAYRHGRRAAGSDLNQHYLDIARDRLRQEAEGTLKTRPMDRPVHDPGR